MEVRQTKNVTSPSIVPRLGELTAEERAFTERTLLAMANDIVLLQETTERVVTLFRSMALQYRVPVESSSADEHAA